MKNRPYKKLLRQTKAWTHDYMLDVVWPQQYRKAAKNPVDPRKVLFIERIQSDLPASFKLLWQHLQKTGNFDLQFVSLGKYQIRFRDMHERLTHLVPEVATARFIFLNDASDYISCLPIRPETKVVQLWHACGALKKWGKSLEGNRFGRTREYLSKHPNYGNLSLVPVSSPEVIWAYEEAMGLQATPGVVQPMGVSRTDKYFDRIFLEDSRTKLEQIFPACNEKRILLYAPTFRGHMKRAISPAFLDYLEMAQTGGISDTWRVIVKDHPLVRVPSIIDQRARDFAFTAPGELDIDVLLAASNALLTDYSSTIFEYSLLNRPMALLAPDYDDYCDERGFYYNYKTFAPGPILSTTGDVLSWMAQMTDTQDDSQSALVPTFRARYMRSCDGSATERLVQWMQDAPITATQTTELQS